MQTALLKNGNVLPTSSCFTRTYRGEEKWTKIAVYYALRGLVEMKRFSTRMNTRVSWRNTKLCRGRRNLGAARTAGRKCGWLMLTSMRSDEDETVSTELMRRVCVCVCVWVRGSLLLHWPINWTRNEQLTAEDASERVMSHLSPSALTWYTPLITSAHVLFLPLPSSSTSGGGRQLPRNGGQVTHWRTKRKGGGAKVLTAPLKVHSFSCVFACTRTLFILIKSQIFTGKRKNVH